MQLHPDKHNWPEITRTLQQQGFVIVPDVLSDAECEQLKNDYTITSHYRKVIHMERYRFGKGEYKYFSYPLPPIIQQLRESIYEKIAPVANTWMQQLQLSVHYPETHAEMKEICHQQQQQLPTVLILKYEAGGFNTLHQDLYGEIFFPIQMVFMLDQIGEDYEGGEFVITEQIPRAQSKANVLKPGKGAMLLFATNYRPVKGTHGFYRVNMKHGVSPLHSGQRYSLGVIFHDALT
ncbi:2OG-Fe(II) oxygenase [Chitinophaga sp. Cy-1792]|uniref:2OG-Fe(II) oxygenase n=1 Tax=Chitinophaga sp. Cy-1792 TaxID=2608339 RepID=UPI00142289D2|nr:2OG-Fe(II) oxygenase [Chitinophaga sp. Cy-1792]NIG57510.1 2OG-Fe(II) oxygenase [Chitinophaga sp. Cy-1792]